MVVGGEQGYVRKISVRSTELETFDRANVLIPNSYFISEKVKNWTFRNNVCRISISVGVAYGSDARQVQAALLAVAQKHPEVLTAPAPSVTLDDFAASNITFTLYAFIGDITRTALSAPIWRSASWMLLPRPASPFLPGETKSPFATWTACAR